MDDYKHAADTSGQPPHADGMDAVADYRVEQRLRRLEQLVYDLTHDSIRARLMTEFWEKKP